MSATLLKLPVSNLKSVPDALRDLADSIEAGRYDDAHSLAWVIDCGDGKIAVGLLGKSVVPAPEAHYLLALGMRRLESI